MVRNDGNETMDNGIDKHDISSVSKLCELAMTSDADIENISSLISRFDDVNRPRPLRKASQVRIGSIINFWRSRTAEDLTDRYNFRNPSINLANDTRGNSSMSDLLVTEGSRRLNVETKFGAATNANIGLKRMSTILGVPAFILPRTVRDEIIGDMPLAGITSGFVDTALNTLQNFMKDYVNSFDWNAARADGAAVRDAVMSSGAEGNARLMNGDYVIYLYGRSSFTSMNPSLTGGEEWTIHPTISRTMSSCRLTYFLEEVHTGDRIITKFNNKNSLYVEISGQDRIVTSQRNGIGVVRVPSRLQLGVPSYNVWYKKNR